MKQRPLGITLLSIFYLMSAAILLIFIISSVISAKISLSQLKPEFWIIAVIDLFYRLISIAAGIFMWSGRKAGWYLSLFYPVYIISCLVIPLVFSFDTIFISETDRMETIMSYLLVGSISISICQYLFKNHVLKFFGMDNVGQSRIAIEVITIVAVAIAVVFFNMHIGLKI